MIKKGSVVRYANPTPDEMYNDSLPMIYRVVEDNDSRVIIEPVYWNYDIRPQAVALKDDLVLSFKEHPWVPVPSFVDFEQWADTSWGNDETASIEAKERLGDQYYLKVWIYSEEDIKALDAANDMFPDYHYSKYIVCIGDEDGHMTIGRQAFTDEDVIKIIAEFKADWQTLVKTEEWL